MALVDDLPSHTSWLYGLGADAAATLAAKAEQIDEASDKFSSWFRGPDYVVKRRTDGKYSVCGPQALELR